MVETKFLTDAEEKTLEAFVQKQADEAMDNAHAVVRFGGTDIQVLGGSASWEDDWSVFGDDLVRALYLAGHGVWHVWGGGRTMVQLAPGADTDFTEGQKLNHYHRGTCYFVSVDEQDKTGATVWVYFEGETAEDACMVTTSLLTKY
jgi:hypothetical protein